MCWKNRPKEKAPHVQVIPDNHSPHNTAALRAWRREVGRVHVRLTPTSAPWINPLGRWIGVLVEHGGLPRRPSRPVLSEKAVSDHGAAGGGPPKALVRTRDADKLLAGAAR